MSAANNHLQTGMAEEISMRLFKYNLFIKQSVQQTHPLTSESPIVESETEASAIKLVLGFSISESRLKTLFF